MLVVSRKPETQGWGVLSLEQTTIDSDPYPIYYKSRAQ